MPARLQAPMSKKTKLIPVPRPDQPPGGEAHRVPARPTSGYGVKRPRQPTRSAIQSLLHILSPNGTPLVSPEESDSRRPQHAFRPHGHARCRCTRLALSTPAANEHVTSHCRQPVAQSFGRISSERRGLAPPLKHRPIASFAEMRHLRAHD
jgi:hypothetical protein